jgi:hypothetical protein
MEGNMKRLIMKRVFLILSLILSACATPREATWKTLPESNIPYDKAWTIVVNTVSEYFTDLETIDGQSGYLRSGWKTTDTCWLGLYKGGKVPCKRARVIVRVEERTPFKVKVRVEQEEVSKTGTYFILGSGVKWVSTGNDENLEREIMDTLMGRLRKW